MKKSLAFMLAFAMASAFAINNVAVLELLPSESAREEIKIEEARHLTDELRKQAVETLPSGEYSVLTRDNIMALMPADEAAAERIAESGAVEIGRAIGAQYVSQGTIGKFGKKLTISVELYETMGGKLLSSIVFESEGIEGLLGAIRSEAKPLFKSVVVSASLNNRGSSRSMSEAEGMRIPQWVGICLFAAGIGFGVYGISQNSQYKSKYNDYRNLKEGDFDAKWKKADDAKGRRNIGYIAGSALLASGIGVFFAF